MTVSMRDFHLHLQRYIDKVAGGATVTLTKYGRVVAVLGPPPVDGAVVIDGTAADAFEQAAAAKAAGKAVRFEPAMEGA